MSFTESWGPSLGELFPIPHRLIPRLTNHEQYRDDPCGYAEHVLHVDWWDKQKEVARALLVPPYKVLVLASHGVGKTHLAGGLVNWWYDTRPRDSAVLTTAPTDREVSDLTWREVRFQRGDRGGFRGTSAPELYESPDHYAKGISPGRAESFQGRHPRHLLILLEEAVGVKPFVWKTLRTMFQPTGEHAVLAIGNPTDTTSDMYSESQSGGWRVIQMSAMDHPNIQRELSGLSCRYPAAVRLAQVDEQVRFWCTPVSESDRVATDVLWPPEGTEKRQMALLGEPSWWRPGPEAEARIFGRWPSSATYGVWSDRLWQAAEAGGLSYDRSNEPVLGCDVARHGDDWTAIHVRRGDCSLHHERGNGWDTVRTAARLMELAREHTRIHIGPEYDKGTPTWQAGLAHKVPIIVDDTGVGGGVTDILRANGFASIGVNAACIAKHDEMYPDVRSELWFVLAERAKQGHLDVSRLDSATRRRLQVQALAPEWAPDAKGRRRLEPKVKTKERCQGRSPDDMDAMNLAYYPYGQHTPEVQQPESRPTMLIRDQEQTRKRLFGR